jgi:hypothetical protein
MLPFETAGMSEIEIRQAEWLRDRVSKTRLLNNKRKGVGEFRIGPVQGKGKKHDYPKSRKSKARGQFKLAVDALKTIEDEKRYQRKLKKKEERGISRGKRGEIVDFAGLSVGEREKKQREALIPVNRKCPTCNKIKIKTSQWVTDREIVQESICLSCFRVYAKANKVVKRPKVLRGAGAKRSAVKHWGFEDTYAEGFG